MVQSVEFLKGGVSGTNNFVEEFMGSNEPSIYTLADNYYGDEGTYDISLSRYNTSSANSIFLLEAAESGNYSYVYENSSSSIEVGFVADGVITQQDQLQKNDDGNYELISSTTFSSKKSEEIKQSKNIFGRTRKYRTVTTTATTNNYKTGETSETQYTYREYIKEKDENK